MQSKAEMTKPSIAIAMTTYNGELFIKQQMKSIFQQFILPKQIVICDDRSTDNTLKIINSFHNSAINEIKVRTNDNRLGVAKNFEKAISLCNKDLIFLCDQDDVWLPRKTIKILQKFKNPTIGLVFSNAELTDKNLHFLGYDMWESIKFKNKEIKLMLNKKETAVLLKHYIVTGATLAFRSKFKPLILPIPQSWNHDTWIALLVSSVANIYPLPEKLILYRQHPNNTIGGIKRNLITQLKQGLTINRNQYYQMELTRYRQLYQRLIDHPEFHPKSEALTQIQAKINHLEARASLPSNRLKRIPTILKEVYARNYKRFARNWGSIALDLFIK